MIRGRLRGRSVRAEEPAQEMDVPTDAEIEAAMQLPLTDEIAECETCHYRDECWRGVRETGRFYLPSCNPRQRKGSVQQAVADTLHQHGALSTLEIVDALYGVGIQSVYSGLKRMRARGEVAMVGVKRYAHAGGRERIWQLTDNTQGG